jgi:chromosome segregation ATPase
MGWLENLKNKREKKRRLLKQIDVIENQYKILIADYSELNRDLVKLRFRKFQIQKQLKNLTDIIEKDDQHG